MGNFQVRYDSRVIHYDRRGFIRLAIGASPIKILQCKFYATLIFNHSDWLINLSSQSECLKNCIA